MSRANGNNIFSLFYTIIKTVSRRLLFLFVNFHYLLLAFLQGLFCTLLLLNNHENQPKEPKKHKVTFFLILILKRLSQTLFLLVEFTGSICFKVCFLVFIFFWGYFSSLLFITNREIKLKL